MNWTVLHQMTFIQEGQVEKWFCPDCGRVVQVAPEFIIMVQGDQQVAHIGVHGGLAITAVVPEQEPREKRKP